MLMPQEWTINFCCFSDPPCNTLDITFTSCHESVFCRLLKVTKTLIYTINKLLRSDFCLIIIVMLLLPCMKTLHCWRHRMLSWSSNYNCLLVPCMTSITTVPTASCATIYITDHDPDTISYKLSKDLWRIAEWVDSRDEMNGLKMNVGKTQWYWAGSESKPSQDKEANHTTNRDKASWCNNRWAVKLEETSWYCQEEEPSRLGIDSESQCIPTI